MPVEDLNQSGLLRGERRTVWLRRDEDRRDERN